MFNIRKRLHTTKLKVFEKTEWVVVNSSVLMDKIILLFDAGMTTGGSMYSSRTAAIDLAHVAEDYLCSDYKCLALDTRAASCDIVATGVSFFPKTKKITMIFAGCSATSKFSRTLRNKCKEMEGGLVGCK